MTKIIICNNHADKLINEYTVKKIAELYQENPNITCLLEGISNKDIAELSRSNFTFNETDQLEPDQVMYMPFTKMMQSVLQSGMKVEGVEIKSPDGDEPRVDTFQEFCKELLSTDMGNGDLQRDAEMFKVFNDFKGDCVLVMGTAHVADWLKKDYLKDIKVIYPNHDNDIKEGLEVYNNAFGKNIQYDDILGKEAHDSMDKMMLHPSVERIDLTKQLPSRSLPEQLKDEAKVVAAKLKQSLAQGKYTEESKEKDSQAKKPATRSRL